MIAHDARLAVITRYSINTWEMNKGVDVELHFSGGIHRTEGARVEHRSGTSEASIS